MPQSSQGRSTSNLMELHARDSDPVKHPVVLLTTGGTIAMKCELSGAKASVAMDGQQLQQSLQEDSPISRVEDIAALPSSHFQLDTLWSIRDRVADIVAEPDTAGIVITHGTDTIEETAYLLDLTVTGEKPIVLTGAMRTASDPGYDGRSNLIAAVRAASSLKSRGLGAIIVMNDEIHAARFATKAHTLSPAALQSPGWGPIGRIAGDCVQITHRPKRTVLPWLGLEPNVILLKLGVAMETHLLDYALSRGARGLVIEGFGSGRVPPSWVPAIEKARNWGVTVVIASRCISGPMWDNYNYSGAYQALRDLGCLFADELNGQKARIKLMVSLASAQTPDEVSVLWHNT
jgi:L-asparaginase